MEDKNCGNCYWKYDDGFCSKGASENCADYVNDEDICEYWESVSQTNEKV